MYYADRGKWLDAGGGEEQTAKSIAESIILIIWHIFVVFVLYISTKSQTCIFCCRRAEHWQVIFGMSRI